MIPLNQTYQMKDTLRENLKVRSFWCEYERYLVKRVGWVPHDLNPILGKPGEVHVGRSYDAALAMAAIDFTDMTVLELGARASFLGCYLTAFAESVTMSDLFSGNDMGTLHDWWLLWKKAALKPTSLYISRTDMRETNYPDDSFDAVINISAIEHVPGDGDIEAMIEMARIVRPGGYIVLGTDTSDEFRIKRGKYYDEDALYERLIEPSGCFVEGPVDLSWENCDQDAHRSKEFDRSSCLFVLKKEES